MVLYQPVRLINGTTLLYPNGTTFTPPQQELTLVPNTVLLACQNSDDVTQDAAGKTITAAGNLNGRCLCKNATKSYSTIWSWMQEMYSEGQSNKAVKDICISQLEKQRRGRGRGIIAGGSPGSDNNEQIEFFDIQSDGVVTVFGELITSRRSCGGCSSSTRGLIGGGTASNPSPTFTNSMEFITIATTGNGTDFGDLNNTL